MKCISLMQPWATLVVTGAKSFETRSWQTDYRGRLAVHASRRFPEEARALCAQEPFRSALQRAGYYQSADLPTGALLGSIELIDCLPTNAVLCRLPANAPERCFGDYQGRRWAWRLAQPTRLLVPRPFTGRLGLYEIPDLEPELPFVEACQPS